MDSEAPVTNSNNEIIIKYNPKEPSTSRESSGQVFSDLASAKGRPTIAKLRSFELTSMIHDLGTITAIKSLDTRHLIVGTDNSYVLVVDLLDNS